MSKRERDREREIEKERKIERERQRDSSSLFQTIFYYNQSEIQKWRKNTMNFHKLCFLVIIRQPPSDYSQMYNWAVRSNTVVVGTGWVQVACQCQKTNH